jgi:hypothetical protein
LLPDILLFSLYIPIPARGISHLVTGEVSQKGALYGCSAYLDLLGSPRPPLLEEIQAPYGLATLSDVVLLAVRTLATRPAAVHFLPQSAADAELVEAQREETKYHCEDQLTYGRDTEKGKTPAGILLWVCVGSTTRAVSQDREASQSGAAMPAPSAPRLTRGRPN